MWQPAKQWSCHSFVMSQRRPCEQDRGVLCLLLVRHSRGYGQRECLQEAALGLGVETMSEPRADGFILADFQEVVSGSFLLLNGHGHDWYMFCPPDFEWGPAHPRYSMSRQR